MNHQSMSRYSTMELHLAPCLIEFKVCLMTPLIHINILTVRCQTIVNLNSLRGNLIHYSISSKGSFICTSHRHDNISFDTPVVEHWLKCVKSDNGSMVLVRFCNAGTPGEHSNLQAIMNEYMFNVFLNCFI